MAGTSTGSASSTSSRMATPKITGMKARLRADVTWMAVRLAPGARSRRMWLCYDIKLVIRGPYDSADVLILINSLKLDEITESR
jgi:hypothetical protein